jgi:glutamine amidotransferase
MTTIAPTWNHRVRIAATSGSQTARGFGIGFHAILGAAIVVSVWCALERRALACELMAVSCNQNAPTQSLVDAFRRHGARNPDGWGLAFYPDRSAMLFREPANAAESKLAEFLTTYPGLKTRLLIAHVRKAAVGEPSLQNTHPFVRELGGKEYVLAHNGVLKNYQNALRLSRIKPLGRNDTEFLLCYLLGRIDQEGITQWNPRSFVWLQKELRAINDFGSLNCVFSDGTHLFAYHDKNGYSNLCHVARREPYGPVRFPDLSKTIDLGAEQPKSAVAVVVATKPLTDEPWRRFSFGELLVIRDGIQVFPQLPAVPGKPPL